MMTSTLTMMAMTIKTCSAACLMVAACGGPSDVPRVEELRYLGQAKDSTLVLLFEVDFSDDNGDLNEGRLETFINDRATRLSQQPLAPLLLESGISPTATTGTFDLALEIAFVDGVEVGASFDVGTRIVDAQNHVSDTETVTLRIE
jgi:hypothetical protein